MDIGIAWQCMARNVTCVWTNPVYTKPGHVCLLNKFIAAGFNLGFNVKSLLDWHNFDLPKLMPTEHISTDTCIIVVSYVIKYLLQLSQSEICRHQPPQRWKIESYLISAFLPFNFLTNPLSHFPSLTLLMQAKPWCHHFTRTWKNHKGCHQGFFDFFLFYYTYVKSSGTKWKFFAFGLFSYCFEVGFHQR